MVIVRPINRNISFKLHPYSLLRTLSPPGPRLPKTFAGFSGHGNSIHNIILLQKIKREKYTSGTTELNFFLLYIYIYIYMYSGTKVIERLSIQTNQSSIEKCLCDHTSRADENGIRTNDKWGKLNSAERLAESTRAVSVSISPSRPPYPTEQVSDIAFV